MGGAAWWAPRAATSQRLAPLDPRSGCRVLLPAPERRAWASRAAERACVCNREGVLLEAGPLVTRVAARDRQTLPPGRPEARQLTTLP